MEKRILALDIGDRRIGVAVTDPFNSYAMPVETYYRTGDFWRDVAAMARYAAERDVGEIVCGLPVNADGSDSIQTEKTLRFIYALQEEAPMPVYCEDERFTSIQAHEVLHEEGLRAKKHKKNVDSIAASYILESYLAHRGGAK
jgi:putative Holliday junction resolvase